MGLVAASGGISRSAFPIQRALRKVRQPEHVQAPPLDTVTLRLASLRRNDPALPSVFSSDMESLVSRNSGLRLVFAAALITLAVLGAAACSGRNTVSGTITFDGDAAIPDGSVLTVQLRDVSYQGAASILIAEQTIENPKRFPLDFSVQYDPGDIDQRAIYGLGIRITLNDRLLYINDTAFDVLTRGNPHRNVKTWVVAVGS